LRFHVDKNFVINKNLFDEANMEAAVAGRLAHFTQILALFAHQAQLTENQMFVMQEMREKKKLGH
jgi:hypothetical protein